MKQSLATWKQLTILLSSVGLAWIGDFIYLVSINLLIYQMTGSAVAVAGMWIIGPVVNIFTKIWTGSFIDYRSKRKIMIVTYLTRAALIFFLTFAPNIWLIYTLLIGLSVAKSFFIPSSMTYTTKLVPKEMRKRYNAIQSLTTSGAFIIGPAIGGSLILLTNINTTFFLNSSLFLMSSLLIYLLPELDTYESKAPKLTFSQIKDDWSVAISFMKKNCYVAFIYGAFLATMIFSFAMDTQEVVFTQQVIGLSEMDYSLLISITGIGSIVGASTLSLFTNKISIRFLISIGIIMETIGYLIYAFSWSFLSLAVGFTILGLFFSFSNAGMTTFYQNNVPTDVMGRVTSIFQLLQSLLQIIFVLLVGVVSEVIPLRITIVCLASCMFVLAIMITFSVYQPSKKDYFKETTNAI